VPAQGEVRAMCDGHKAQLIKKALRIFNGTKKWVAARSTPRFHWTRARVFFSS
jgi:hypothetical protein